MEKECIHGKMAVNTTESINMIKNMGMVYMFGQMEEDTKDFGHMESILFL